MGSSDDDTLPGELPTQDPGDASTLAPELASTQRSASTRRPGTPERVGRHIILHKLGEGGMGVVLAAYDPDLDRKIAVKLIRGEIGPRQTARLSREAQAMAKVSHANVIHIYDVGTQDGALYVAMELVDGPTLRAWTDEQPRSWPEVLDVYSQAASGLAAAHDAGLVHRDFKPENALVGTDGVVRVLDFGLAIETKNEPPADDAAPPTREEPSKLTATGALMGTPAYMAPEQFAGEATDAKTDQFSFCVALYEALYRQRPFAGKTIPELAQSVTMGELRPPPPDAKVPTWLRDLVLRGLSLDANDRHPSMHSLLAELNRDRAAARRRRRTFGGALLVVGVSLGAVALSSSRDEQPKCQSALAEIEGTWSSTEAQAVRDAFEQTQLPFATKNAQAVIEGLDAYTAQWAEQHQAACEATWVHGAQSERMLDLRMACLARRRVELAAAIDLLSKPDPKVAERGLNVVAGLPGLHTCADLEALEAEIPPPDGPQVQASVDEVRAELAEVSVRQHAGKYDDALEIANRADESAKQVDYPPVQAEARRQLGSSLAYRGEYDRAEQALEESYWIALRIGYRTQMLTSATALASLLGTNQQDPDAAENWWRHADAIATWTHAKGKAAADVTKASAVIHDLRGEHEQALAEYRRAWALAKEDPEAHELLDGYYLIPIGNALTRLGRAEEAQEEYEKALQLWTRAFGSDHPNVAFAHEALGVAFHDQGEAEAAAEHFSRALAIRERLLGPDHPQLASTHSNLGVLAKSLHRYDEADTHYQRALEIDTRAHGPEHPDVASTLMNMGNMYVQMGAAERAIEPLTRALEIFESVHGPEHPDVGQASGNVANALREVGKWDEAKKMYERAMRIVEATSGDTHPEIAFISVGLARVYMEEGRPRPAVPLLERALEIRTKAGVDPRLVAEARFYLASALWDSGGDRQRARRLATEALDVYAAREADADDAQEIRTWLAQH